MDRKTRECVQQKKGSWISAQVDKIKEVEFILADPPEG
jgi:hypothetical protein